MPVFTIDLCPQPESMGGGYIAELRFEHGSTIAVERGDNAHAALVRLSRRPGVEPILQATSG